MTLHLSMKQKLALGAAALVGIGAAGGAGAVALTRPTIEMAPTVPTAIGKLSASDGIVTVKGRVAAVYGDRFVIEDQTGRTLVAGGRDQNVTAGAPVTVQGRFDDGQLRAHYLVDGQGRIAEVGPRHHGHGDTPPPPPPPGAGAPPPPGAGAPPPPPGGPGAPPPPPPGAGAPPPPPPGAVPPPVTGAAPPAPAVGQAPPAPVPAQAR